MENIKRIDEKTIEVDGIVYKAEKKEDKIGKPASLFRVFLIATIITGLLYFLLHYVEKWQ